MSTPELVIEDRYVGRLYARLDDLRERTTARRTSAWRERGGTAQSRFDRDSVDEHTSRRLAQLAAAEHGLCFGRLDLDDGTRTYVGRLGLLDDDEDLTPLLVDWRAPAARPFYVATGLHPCGVRRRRHLTLRGRHVVDLTDEVMSTATPEDADGSGGDGSGGDGSSDGALLAALAAGRTGRMRDIVETIQADQDRIIRDERRGVLVVQGGPGTGKTAVALHRAAYLLYTHRERLSRSVVLVVGPNPTFLRYVSRVLPSLGETGVVLANVGRLHPGVTATGRESAATAAVKGRSAMADVVAAAVADRQTLPAGGVEVTVDGEALHLDERTWERARSRALERRPRHNEARQLVATAVADALARQVAERLATGVGDRRLVAEAVDRDALRRRLRQEPAVRAVLDRCWPVLTPQRLLSDLFASDARLEAAAPQLSAEDRAALRREPGGGWTPADVPLLDEAAELLGEDDRGERAAAAAARRRDVEYAQGVIDVASRGTDTDDIAGREFLVASDVVDAEHLAEWHAAADHRTQAERAAADRTWAYGHVIVDEAQELSPMAWRTVMRRCPSRSMTLVGDVAQTGDPAGAASWAEVLAPHVGDRWRLAELSVNYRTPAEIMAVAADVLAAAGAPTAAPRSVRETGVVPWHRRVDPVDLPAAVAAAAVAERDAVTSSAPDGGGAGGAGRVAVVVPDELRDAVAAGVLGALPDAGVGDDPDLERHVVVVTVAQAKGLEFDAVLVVEPARLLDASPRGANDLYVALTRTTGRLGVVHAEPLPAVLDRLAAG